MSDPKDLSYLQLRLLRARLAAQLYAGRRDLTRAEELDAALDLADLLIQRCHLAPRGKAPSDV